MKVALSHEQEAVAMFDAYCKTVIQNKARRFWARVRARRIHEELTPDVGEIVDTLPRRGIDYTYSILLGEIRADFENEKLYQAVQGLKTNEKRVILLKYWYGYTDEVIAEQLRVTDRTVRNLKKRAYERIYRFLIGGDITHVTHL